MNCGIDFGTSNSALAFSRESAVDLARFEGNNVTLPSAVFYPAGMPALVGRKAMQTFVDGQDGRFMRSLKRILGTSLMNQGTAVNGKMMKFQDILADFIGYMKNTAEKQLGSTLTNVVMGRPVHFVDGDAAADSRAESQLREISRKVGFKNVEFQYEPIAAAFAHELKLEKEKLAIVADIGGGTSDFTVIRLSGAAKNKPDRKNDILANTGIRTGGNDFDKDLCLSAFMPNMGYLTTYGEKNMPLPVGPFFEMSEWSKINFLYTPKIRNLMDELYLQSHATKKFGRFIKILKEETGHNLLSTVEESKILLTEAESAVARLEFVEEGLQIPVSKKKFDKSTEKHVKNISKSLAECLKQAGVRQEEIEMIVLTGGTTEIPALKEAIRKKFPAAEISEENKLSSVGLGLGYDSLRKFN